MFLSSFLFKVYWGFFAGSEADCSPASSADVKNMWSHTSARYIYFHGGDCAVYILSPQTERRSPPWEVSGSRFHL